MCDLINNNKYCWWDGGDCCFFIIKNRIVCLVLSDCKLECVCKDFDVKENEELLNGGVSGMDDEDDEDEGEKFEGSGLDDMMVI